MTPKESMELIFDLEKKIEKIDFKFMGIDCWPVVRNTILSIFYDKENRTESRSKKYLYLLYDFYCSLKTFRKIGKCESLFISDSKYSEVVGGKRYLKDVHVLCDKNIKKNNKNIIGIQNSKISNDIINKGDCFSFYSFIIVATFFSRISSKIFKSNYMVQYVNQVINILNLIQCTSDSNINKSSILRQKIIRNIYYCVFLKLMFCALLKFVKPNSCFVVCYYSLVGMSFCAACKRQSVNVNDVQHGVSGSYMRSYAKWPCPSSGTFNTLPNLFLTWTDYDLAALNDWISSDSCALAAEKLSMSWRDFMKATELYDVSSCEWSGFFEETSKYKYSVVVTLQFLNVSSVILRLMNNVSDDVCFYVRLHPDYSLDKHNNKLTHMFSNVKNVFYEEPSSMPISLLMSHSDLHLTEWSSSVYDAYFEGVVSLVSDSCGRDYFRDFINDGHAFYVGENNSLMDFLN